MGSIQYLNERSGASSTKNQQYDTCYRSPESWNRLSLSTPPPPPPPELSSPRSHPHPLGQTKSLTSYSNYSHNHNPIPTDIHHDHDHGGGGDNPLQMQRSSCHQLQLGPGPGKDRVQYQLPSSPRDYYRSSNIIKEWVDMVKDKREKIILAKKSTCKFCETTDKNGICQCPLHLPAVHSRYMRAFEDKTRNSVSIYIFRNGENRVSPVLIQIPRRSMQSMEDTIKVIDQSVRFPVGYAHALYTLCGEMIYEPGEIKPYETYVVVNNVKRKFVHMDYGNKRPENLYWRRRRRFYPGAFNVQLSHQ